MIRPTLLLLLPFFIFQLAFCQQSNPDFIQDPFPDKQAQIAQMLQDIFIIGKNKELDKLAAFHLYGPKFTKFDDTEPMGRMDAAQGKAGEDQGFSALEDATFNIQDLKVDVFDRVAIATFIMDYSVKIQGQTYAAKSRATMVFVEAEKGRWKITHEHFSSFKPSM